MNSLVNQIVEYFYRQTRREQIILLVGGGCVLLYVIWFFLVMSLQGAVTEERARTQSVSKTLARVESLAVSVYHAEQVREKESQKPFTSIAELVDLSLRANGLTMRGFQPSSDGEVRLRLDNVPYASLIQWLYELEALHGVQVKELATSASNTAGLVMVNVRLRKE